MTITTYPYAVADQVFPIPPCWTTVAGSIVVPGTPDNQPWLGTGDIPGRPGDPRSFGTAPGYHYSTLTAEGQLGFRDIIAAGLVSGAAGLAGVRSMLGTPTGSDDPVLSPDNIFGSSGNFWTETTGVIGLGVQPWDAGTRTPSDYVLFEDFWDELVVLYPPPVTAASNDPGVTLANVDNSLVGSLYATRATNAWYKMFQPWCFFDYGAAQTGYVRDDAETGMFYNQNGYTGVAGPTNFQFKTRQLRPETDFFDHERMPIVILDSNRAYLCAAYPLMMGLIHSFFEVSVWIANSTTELYRVALADIRTLQLTSLVLNDGTIYHRLHEFDYPTRNRGFCGLVYRNLFTSAFGGGPENPIPGSVTLYTQWGHAGRSGWTVFDGGQLVYATDVNDLRKQEPAQGLTSLTYTGSRASPTYEYQLDLANDEVHEQTWYLDVPLVIPPGTLGTDTPYDGGGQVRLTTVRDLHRYDDNGMRYVLVPTDANAAMVMWNNNAGSLTVDQWLNGAPLTNFSTADDMFIPEAPWPIRGKFGTYVGGQVYRGTREPLFLIEPVWSHLLGWTKPVFDYTHTAGGTSAGDGFDPNGIGITPNAPGTAPTAMAAGTTLGPADLPGGIALYQYRAGRSDTGGPVGYDHSHFEATRPLVSGGATGSNYNSLTRSPNASTTFTGGPIEADQHVFFSWKVRVFISGEKVNNFVHTDYPCHAVVEILLWDLVGNTAGQVLQTETISTPGGGTYSYLYGVEEIDLASLPEEWVMVIRVKSGTSQAIPDILAGGVSSVLIQCNLVSEQTQCDYWWGVPQATLRSKYEQTEIAARGGVLMDEDIIGIDSIYISTETPPFIFPDPEYL